MGLLVSTKSRTSFKIGSLVVRLASNFPVENLLSAQLKASPYISVDVFGVNIGVRLASVDDVPGNCWAFVARLAFCSSKCVLVGVSVVYFWRVTSMRLMKFFAISSKLENL